MNYSIMDYEYEGTIEEQYDMMNEIMEMTYEYQLNKQLNKEDTK